MNHSVSVYGLLLVYTQRVIVLEKLEGKAEEMRPDVEAFECIERAVSGISITNALKYL